MISVRINNSRECGLLEEYLIKSGHKWNSGTSLSDKPITDELDVFPGLINIFDYGAITYYNDVYESRYTEFKVYYETVIVKAKLKEFLNV